MASYFEGMKFSSTKKILFDNITMDDVGDIKLGTMKGIGMQIKNSVFHAGTSNRQGMFKVFDSNATFDNCNFSRDESIP
jgi:hypothetical protein